MIGMKQIKQNMNIFVTNITKALSHFGNGCEVILHLYLHVSIFLTYTHMYLQTEDRACVHSYLAFCQGLAFYLLKILC